MPDTTPRPETVETPVCRVSWCPRPVTKYQTPQLCNICYGWSRRNNGADPESPTRPRIQPKTATRTCTAMEDGERCNQPQLARGMCNRHWLRHWKHGDTSKRRRSPGEMQALVAFAARATTDDCILTPCDRSRPGVHYRGVPMTATRAVWIEATGEDPGDRQVLHTCHRGDDGCINVRHLYLGDHQRNMRDMVEAERQARGEDNGNADLTEADVREIRSLYATRAMSQRALARRFGVWQGTIHQIVNHKTWRHVV